MCAVVPRCSEICTVRPKCWKKVYNDCNVLDDVYGEATSFEEWHTEVTFSVDVYRQAKYQ